MTLKSMPLKGILSEFSMRATPVPKIYLNSPVRLLEAYRATLRVAEQPEAARGF